MSDVLNKPALKRGVVPPRLDDPYADDVTQPFWDKALQGVLSCTSCRNCQTKILPPQPRCFVCQSKDFDWVDLPGTGTIYTFTVVRHPLSEQFAQVVPYITAVIELDGAQGAGARMQLNVINCDVEKVRIGDKVKIIFDKVTETYAMPRAEPA
jgi:uncharacterized OB-fold protein